MSCKADRLTTLLGDGLAIAGTDAFNLDTLESERVSRFVDVENDAQNAPWL